MKYEQLITECAQAIVERYGPSLEALILVGSFARGEEIVRKNRDGTPVYVSDMEFLAVVKSKSYPLTMVASSSEGVEISIGQTTKEHLKKLRPTIFALELKKFGKIVWGKANMLDYIPAFTEKDIDPLDAFILLNNRIVEQLKLRMHLEAELPVDGYLFDKGYIQIVNSILAFKRKYQCLYPDKLKAFMTLNDPQFIHLSTAVKEAFDNCRTGRSAKFEALSHWARLREAMKWLWLLEAKELLRKPDLTAKQAINDFPKIVPQGDRIKGWAKVIKDRKLSLLGVGTLKNILSVSPQFLVYQDAVALYFSDKFDKGKVEKVVAKWEKIVK